MTPTSPMPSVHDVVIGKFVANLNDQAAGITTGKWGLTTYILTEAAECSQGSETAGALARADYYRKFRSMMGIAVSGTEDLGCASVRSTWPADGAG